MRKFSIGMRKVLSGVILLALVSAIEPLIAAEAADLMIKPINIKILPAGEKRTYQITLNKSAKATYALINAPKWMNVDRNTGLVTFNAPKGSTEKYSFCVSASVNGEKLKSKKISGVVKTINATLQDDLKKAPKRLIVDTGASVGSVRTSSTYLVPNNMNPKTPEENTWDIIQPYFKSYSQNIEVVTIDGQTGKITKIETDKENWHGNSSLITKEGKMYHVSKKSRNNQQPTINIYDPVSNKWTLSAIKTPKTFKGSEYALITMAPDGAVFVASNNIDGTKNDYTLRFLQIDSATNKIVNDSGPIGKEKGGLWQLAADNNYVYLLIGKVPWRVLQYNRKTHAVTVLAKAKSRLSIQQTAFGVVMSNEGKYNFLYKGKVIPAEHPKDWRAAKAPWPFPEGYTTQQKWHTLVIKRNIVELSLPKKPKIITQNVKAINGKAEIWVKQAADKNFKKHAYEVKTYPTTLLRLVQQPDGKILAGTGAYGPYLRYDTKTKQTENIDGMIGLSLGVITKYKDKVYMAGYPMGALYEYDYTKPWTQGIHSWQEGSKGTPYTDQSLNPRFCCKLSDTGSGAHTIKATAIANGELYFGGAWKRNGVGGGLGWYDPKTRKSGGLWKPFSNYQIHYMTSILGGKYVAIGTVPVTDVQLKKPKPKTGRIFLFNPKTKKIEKFYDPVPEFKHGSPGQMVNTDGPYIIGMTNRPERRAKETYIYRLNMLTGQMDYKIEIKDATLWNGPSIGRTLIKTPDGDLLFWAGSVISKLNPVSGQITPIAKYSDKKQKWFGYMGEAVLIGNDLYIAKFKSLIKLPDVLVE